MRTLLRVEPLELRDTPAFVNPLLLALAHQQMVLAQQQAMLQQQALVQQQALLQQQVSVAIIDLVTTRSFNLYGELLEFIGHNDPSLGPEPPPIYAVACRATMKGNALATNLGVAKGELTGSTQNGDTWLLETWAHVLQVGQPLPTLPLWLADNFAVPLELEACYEETCGVLRIP